MSNPSGEAVRARICRHVRENPGVHFRDLQRTLGLSPGQAVHHLERLVGEGLLVGRSAGGYTHYYPAGAPSGARAAQAALRQPARRAVAEAVEVRGPLTLSELSDATGYATSTLHHHVRVLREAGVLDVSGGRPARYALVAAGAEVLAGARPARA